MEHWGESFMQPVKPIETPYSVNIPMLFYYKKKVHKGFIPLANLFRSLLLISVPGGGKTFSVIIPIIKQFIAKSFTLCIYDIKYPDLAKVAYHHYLLAKQKGKCLDYKFHVINLNEVEKSERVNPWKRQYLNTLADASETAEALVEAMKKGDRSGAVTSSLHNPLSIFWPHAFIFSAATKMVGIQALRMCFLF